jgi:integrative and conjugative element protein (TIGR02256 family)
MSPQIVKSVGQAIRYTKTDKSRIIFDEAVIDTLMCYRQNSSLKVEAGGLLLGRHLKGGSHIAVDLVSEPMRGDRRTRTSFFRGRGHERFAHECWHNSKGVFAYLGNWHTHPCMYPLPSETDFDDWRNVLKNDIYEGKNLYFVIVGTKGLACWEGCSQHGKFVKLEEYIFP